MTEGSGTPNLLILSDPYRTVSGSRRPKIVRIRQIRIRNTAFCILLLMLPPLYSGHKEHHTWYPGTSLILRLQLEFNNASDPSAPDAVCLAQNRAAAQRSHLTIFA